MVHLDGRSLMFLRNMQVVAWKGDTMTAVPDASEFNETMTFAVANPETGEIWPVEMDVSLVARFLQIIKTQGIEDAIVLALAGFYIAGREPTKLDTDRIQYTLGSLEYWTTHYPDPERLALEYSYWMLAGKKLTRDQVTERASALLGQPLQVDAWRKRIDRWSEKRGLPPLGQTKRRSRKLIR